MNNQPTYQLTKHPIRSLKEIWAVSWPLMLGLLSGSLMFFSDRLILAHYSVQAMNGAANGGMAGWAAIVLPLAIAEITEVFVGRFNGEGKLAQVGRPVWQMIWLSLLLFPLFSVGSSFIGPFIFAGTGNTQFECDYFITMCNFAPCQLAFISLSGFFIGTGRMKIVTYAMVLGNLLNIGLDFLFIFGFAGIPPMGCQGAALATGLSQLCQVLLLLGVFLNKANREKYGTGNLFFDKKLVRECMKIAIPSGIGRFIEVLAHLAFFRIMITAGVEAMTVATLVQSIYLLMGFIIDGLAKGATALFSNLFGANRQDLVVKVLKSTVSLHGILFCLFALIVLGFTEQIAGCFFSEAERELLLHQEFLFTLKKATGWMTIFFLFDGLCWIFFGLFTACGDTKFVMYVNTVVNWIAYVLPVYIVIGIYKGSADLAWMILAFYNALIFGIYFLRFRQKITKQLRAYATSS